jgi:hypothetical protein
MNNAYNESIKSTPFMLNYGQNPDTPIVLFLRKSNPLVNMFVCEWSEQLQCAKQCLQAAQNRQKKSAPTGSVSLSSRSKWGDQVFINIKHFNLQVESHTAAAVWLESKVITPILATVCCYRGVGPQKARYRVDLPPPLHRKHDVFHNSSLKQYHRNGIYQPSSLPEVAEEEVSFSFLPGCSRSRRGGVCSLIAAFNALVGASMADDVVPAGSCVLASGLVRRSPSALVLPPVSRDAGRCPLPIRPARGAEAEASLE